MSTKIEAIFKTPVPKPDPVVEPTPEAANPEGAAAKTDSDDVEMKPEATAEAAPAEKEPAVDAADLD